MNNRVLTDTSLPTAQLVVNENNRFQNLQGINPSLRARAPVVWDYDTRFGLVPIWSNASLDNAQVLANGHAWYTEVTTGQISPQTAIRGLRLALSVTSMSRVDARLLFQQDRPANATANELAALTIPNLETFNGRAFALRAPPANLILAAAEGNIPNEDQFAEANVNDQIIGANAGGAAQGGVIGEDPESQRRVAYCFLAAFMMKLLTKSAENAVASLVTMKARFDTFYGPSQLVADFAITDMMAQTYKDALNSQPRILTTYAHALAHTHQSHFDNLDDSEQGVLTYLGLIHFSYTGMHAYTLLNQLRDKSKVALRVLCCLFYSDATSEALTRIADVIINYERTAANPTRNLTFRYAAHFGSEYFSELRTKNCPHLVYAAVHALKVLEAHTDRSDPEKIAGVQTLAASMKRTLRFAGNIIGNTLKNNLLAGAGASQAFVLAAQEAAAQAPQEQPQQNVWEDFNL